MPTPFPFQLLPNSPLHIRHDFRDGRFCGPYDGWIGIVRQFFQRAQSGPGVRAEMTQTRGRPFSDTGTGIGEGLVEGRNGSLGVEMQCPKDPWRMAGYRWILSFSIPIKIGTAGRAFVATPARRIKEKPRASRSE